MKLSFVILSLILISVIVLLVFLGWGQPYLCEDVNCLKAKLSTCSPAKLTSGAFIIEIKGGTPDSCTVEVNNKYEANQSMTCVASYEEYIDGEGGECQGSVFTLGVPSGRFERTIDFFYYLFLDWESQPTVAGCYNATRRCAADLLISEEAPCSYCETDCEGTEAFVRSIPECSEYNNIVDVCKHGELVCFGSPARVV